MHNHNCASHCTYADIIELPEAKAGSTTVGQLLREAEKRLGPGAYLFLDREIVTLLQCPKCHRSEKVLKVRQRISEEETKCPDCGALRYAPFANLTHCVEGSEGFLSNTLAQLGIPPLHIIEARRGGERCYLELTGDASSELRFA